MAKDLKNAKKLVGSIYPEGAIDAEGAITRIEPIITPKQLKTRFLAGIPLEYRVTNEKVSTAELSDAINRAMNILETESNVLIQPVIRRVRLPFDPNLYHKHIWLEVPYKPIQKVVKVSLASAAYVNQAEAEKQYPETGEIYRIPNEWIDTSYALHGKIFVNPLSPISSSPGAVSVADSVGAPILHFVNRYFFVPAFWLCEVVTGYCTEDGNVPVFINELIGARAAMIILDNLIPSYRVVSQAMGIDGLSQSVNDIGYQLLTAKRDKLDQQYREYLRILRKRTNNSFFVSNV